jgi:hypothetical protein
VDRKSANEGKPGAPSTTPVERNPERAPGPRPGLESKGRPETPRQLERKRIQDCGRIASRWAGWLSLIPRIDKSVGASFGIVSLLVFIEGQVRIFLSVVMAVLISVFELH